MKISEQVGRFLLAITAAVTGQFILAPEAYFKDADVLPCLKCSGHKSPFASYLWVASPVERVEEAGDMSQEYTSHYYHKLWR